MVQTFFGRFGWFVALLALQVFVFNHIHLLGYATPMPYIFFFCTLTSQTPRWTYLTAGFLLGLFIDLFTNTPGMAAASLCLTGMIAPQLMRLFLPQDKDKDDTWMPTARTMEWGSFLRYTFCLTVINTVAYSLLEAFTFANWQFLLLSMGGGIIMSFLCVIGIEAIRHNSTKHGK